MIILALLLFAWMLTGGCIMLFRKIPELKQMKVVKGTIIGWEKQKGLDFLNKYVPVVEYKENSKGELQQIVLGTQSSGLFFRPSTEGGFSAMRVVWIVIQKNKDIRQLFEVVAETLLPIGFIGVGLAVLIELLKETG